MSFMDALNPTTIQPSGARKILNMSKRDDAADLIKNEEMKAQMDLSRFLKNKVREEKAIERRNDAIRAMKIRRLRDAAKRAKGKWELAVKELEEALNENLPRS